MKPKPKAHPKQITVGEIKAFLSGLPDDLPVFIVDTKGELEAVFPTWTVEGSPSDGYALYL